MSQVHRKLAPPPSSEIVRLLRELKGRGEPIELSINGKANLTIVDDASYQILEGLVDRLDLIESVRTGLKEIDEGKGIPLEEFAGDVRSPDRLP